MYFKTHSVVRPKSELPKEAYCSYHHNFSGTGTEWNEKYEGYDVCALLPELKWDKPVCIEKRGGWKGFFVLNKKQESFIVDVKIFLGVNIFTKWFVNYCVRNFGESPYRHTFLIKLKPGEVYGYVPRKDLIGRLFGLKETVLYTDNIS